MAYVYSIVVIGKESRINVQGSNFSQIHSFSFLTNSLWKRYKSITSRLQLWDNYRVDLVI